MFEIVKKILGQTNEYGVPIPLLLLVLILYRIIVSKIDRWNEREKYYSELVENLGIQNDTLRVRLNYYLEPGSEYDDKHIDSENYHDLSKKGFDASQVARELIHVGRIYLSQTSIDIVDELIQEHWFISELRAVSTKDYLQLTQTVVSNAYNSIIQDAKKDLNKSH